MQRKELYYASADQRTQIHAREWLPEDTWRLLRFMKHQYPELPYYIMLWDSLWDRSLCGIFWHSTRTVRMRLAGEQDV
ncbi:MAG: hypothetical protein LUE63_09215 [Lachnospiraceae bacterium]|nr:hypothetical protein [Lachnospiraceae bacterium]